jgi:hypothetical protein
MTDLKYLPDDAVVRITPALEALEAVFRPLAQQLTPDDESALDFQVIAE